MADAATAVSPSVSTAAFAGYPLKRSLAALSALDVRWVEPAYIQGYMSFDEGDFSDRAAADLSADLASNGLSVYAVSAHMDLSEKRAGEALARRIDFTKGIGGRVVVSNAGPERGRAAILATIDSCLGRLEGAGVVLALENPGHGHGNLLGNGRDGATLVAEIDSPLVRLNYDVCNAESYGTVTGTLASDLDFALPYAAYLHLKDIREKGQDWTFVPLGQGMIDFSGVAARLAAFRSNVPVGLELPLHLSRPGRGDPMRSDQVLPMAFIQDAIRQSVEHWRNCRAAIG